MASADSPATLQSWLNQATNPNNQEDRWDCIQAFYQLVNQESDGPQVALRLLAHKIHSPQEKEALQALTVLEACMNNCGKRFHKEAGKFRFVNELMKILSPKYLGASSPQKVKDRVTEVLYGWTLWLKDEPKIQKAYSTLKEQGIVKKDPTLPDTLIMAPLPERPTESVFDKDTAKRLSQLLKSTHPEDLETANRLIKNTMQKEQEKAEKVSKRESTLKEVESSTKQLRELLDQHRISGTSLQLSDDVKAVYKRCDNLRPSLFRLASDTEDDDALAQILAANDDLTFVVKAYKDHVQNGGTAGNRTKEATSQDIAPLSPRGIKSYHLIDLSDLESHQTYSNADSPPTYQSSSPDNSFLSEFRTGLNELESLSKRVQQNPESHYDDLMQLDANLRVKKTEPNGGTAPTLRSRGCGDGSMSNGMDARLLRSQQSTGLESSSKTQKQESHVSSSKLEQSLCPPHLLKNVFVPVGTIVSSQLEPITLYDRGGIHVSLHFARDCPPGHPGVAVVVMSAVNTSALQVKNLMFQAAVPKSMLVQLQPASGTNLSPYNPLLPPPTISQVILLANPHGCSVRLRYKLTLTHGDQQLDETGDVNSFPDWRSLIGH